MTSMGDYKPIKEKIGELVRTNKLAIILETTIVFLPFCIGIILSNSVGSDRISFVNQTLGQVGSDTAQS